LSGELTARVQAGQDQFDAGDFFFRVFVDRHPAAVVEHFQRAVCIKRNVDPPAMPGNCLVDAVVDHLVREVIRPRRISVHPGPTTYGVQAAEHLDVSGSVTSTH
jgi:hypothetical protein